MKETFAKPGVAAILERTSGGERYVLVQTRQKPDGGATNGLLELPAGKVREYESLPDALRREVREETGLRVTRIRGAERVRAAEGNGAATLACEPTS